MKNMKIGTAIWVCLLLSFFFGTSAKAESITSPDGQLKLNFSVTCKENRCMNSLIKEKR